MERSDQLNGLPLHFYFPSKKLPVILPGCILCHFRMHSLQHVAVACLAINTECPRIGDCLPSFAIYARASLFAIKSFACCLIVSSPLSCVFIFFCHIIVIKIFHMVEFSRSPLLQSHQISHRHFLRQPHTIS